jgi:pimeloyl-ACP methyl ester carboxylesterase
MATFVLVHGAAHGGWCYGRVGQRLRLAGHEVYAPSLTGLADRKHLLNPAIDLETHIADIVNLLEYEDLEDVVLVGHSYGGMVITGVADRATRRIGHLVYLDAAHPVSGESMADNTLSDLMDEVHRGMREIDGVELVVFPDSPLLRVMGVNDPDDYKWFASKITPHPWRCFTQKLILQNQEAARRIHRTSINCTPILETLPEENFRRRTTESDLVFEIDTGHDLMITEPAAVTDLLIKAAEADPRPSS